MYSEYPPFRHLTTKLSRGWLQLCHKTLFFVGHSVVQYLSPRSTLVIHITVLLCWCCQSQVCKFFLCGFCPSELFTNTRSDVGKYLECGAKAILYSMYNGWMENNHLRKKFATVCGSVGETSIWQLFGHHLSEHVYFPRSVRLRSVIKYSVP